MTAPTSGQAAGVAWFAALEAGAEDPECWDAAAEAAVKASPELAEALKVINRLRALVTRKQTAITDAGISRGLAPDWHEGTFTAAEILAAIGDAPAPEPLPEKPALCAGCGRNPVASPHAGPFGKFCEDCIDRCHESTDAFHRCPVCAETEEYAGLDQFARRSAPGGPS